MLDLTSSLFLGRTHESADGTPLTTGRPAAMDEPHAAVDLADRLARAAGADAGVLHRSTLHALVDLMTVLAPATVLIDAAAYPLSRLAADLSAGRAGTVVRPFRHRDVAHAAALAARLPRPLVVLADGWCVECGLPAPLAALQSVADAHGATLVVDDTQALGILGRRAPGEPFGIGGGGTLPWSGLAATGTVRVASLAKGHGVPLAVTVGPQALVDRLRSADLRWHTSPPTTVEIAAASRAVGDRAGNRRLLRRLGALVRRLRLGLLRRGWPVLGRPFPVVPVATDEPGLAAALAAGLRRRGVRGLVLGGRCRRFPSLAFVLTARHQPADVDRVLAALAQVSVDQSVERVGERAGDQGEWWP